MCGEMNNKQEQGSMSFSITGAPWKQSRPAFYGHHTVSNKKYADMMKHQLPHTQTYRLIQPGSKCSSYIQFG